MRSQQRRQGNKVTDRRYLRRVRTALGLIALGLAFYGAQLLYGKASAPEPAPLPKNGAVRFTDARRQAAEFIAYDHSIELTHDQKKLMDEALSTIPAPCCAEYSIATCCCPCNLAKSSWGLSKFLIAKQHANAAQVSAAASEWLQFTNPHGYTGDACFTKGCNRPFASNGCGGMDDRHVQ
jgi:hypothetical protein